MLFELFRIVFHKKEHPRHIGTVEMELHEALRKAREDTGLSVKSVATTLGVGRAQVWRMEKDAEFISVARLRQLADLYGVPVETLLVDDITIGKTELSYQLIGLAAETVAVLAQRQTKTPSPQAQRCAVLAVVKLQQSKWAENPKVSFNRNEYTALIEEQFRDTNKL